MSYSKELQDIFGLPPLRDSEACVVDEVPNLVQLLLSPKNVENLETIFKEIMKVSTFIGIESMTLIKPFEKQICECATENLIKNIDSTLFIAKIYADDIPAFLKLKISHVLPFALGHSESLNLTQAVSIQLGTDAKDLCIKNIQHILVGGLLEMNQEKFQTIKDNLDVILATSNTFNQQLMLNMTKVTLLLAMELGYESKRPQVEKALAKVIQLTGAGQYESLADYLYDFFIGILDISRIFILEKRRGKNDVTHPQTLNALNHIATLLGPDIESYAVQLITVIQMLGNIPGLQKNASILWVTLIGGLNKDSISIYLPTIVEGLLRVFQYLDTETKNTVVFALHGILFEESILTLPLLLRLPEIPKFEELKHIKTSIDKRIIEFYEDTIIYIETLLESLFTEEFATILPILTRLQHFLKYGNYETIKKLKENYQLFSLLLKLSKDITVRDEIKMVAAKCLGLLGATDPSRLVIIENTSGFIFLGDFGNQKDARNFICNIIQTRLVPSFMASTSVKVHQKLYFTMQELLFQAGFRDLLQDDLEINREILDSWHQFPVKLQNMLHPLLSTTFQSRWDIAIPEYPIYPKVGFSQWLKKWYHRLVEDSNGITRDIFSACIPAVYSERDEIVFHLIPYIILHHIINGNSNTISNISMELVKVLEINSTENNLDEKLRQRSLQAVVHITAYCRKWIQQKQKKSDIDPGFYVKKVNHFLGFMSDKLMSMASYQSKAYAQALMHEEAYIRSIPKSEKPKINENLWKIYAQMNDAENIDAAFSSFDIPLSEEMGIMLNESEGRWELAARKHLDRLVESKLGPQYYGEYFKCLRNEGAYDTMRIRAIELGDKYPESTAQTNALVAEASMKLSQWDALGKLLERPIAETFESLLALIYSSIHSKSYTNSFFYINKARLNLIGEHSALATSSYRSSYHYILNLQILQEVEDCLIAFEKTSMRDPSKPGYKPIEELRNSWNSQSMLLAQDYPTRKQVITSRIRVMDSVREEKMPNSISKMVKADIGNMWLLLAKTAREAGDTSTAFDAVQNAESLKLQYTCIEKAKLYWETQKRDRAIAILKGMSNPLKERNLLLVKYQEEALVQNINFKDAYKIIATEYPKWEEGLFALCAFYERQLPILKKTAPLKNYVYSLVVVIRSYIRALSAGSQMFNQTMPRMLTLWSEFTEYCLMDLKDYPTLTTVEYQDIKSTCELAADKLSKDIHAIKPYQLALVLPRLISRLANDKGIITAPFIAMIKKVFLAYPRMAVWPLLAALESPSDMLKSQCRDILDDVQKDKEARAKTGENYKKIINDAKIFNRVLQGISNIHPRAFVNRATILTQHPGIKLFRDLDLYIPQELALVARLPEPEEEGHDYNPFPRNLPKIQGIYPRVIMMQSLQKPKKIELIGTDGKRYCFLCKTSDDLRKDARVMEFCYMINNFLRKDPEARDRSLYIRTYAVIPLGHEWGLLQWIDNLETLKLITAREYEKHGIDYQSRAEKAKEIMDPVDKPTIPLSSKKKINRFIKEILPSFPCHLNNWFLDCFPEPSLWLAARTRYTNTLAVMSIVGYVLGLGDRHAENILFDRLSGDCIHVDLNMLFDKGSDLPVPEVVPFRLTQSLVDALGVLGYKGKFEKSCRVTLRVLQENKESLLSVFETFVHDPVSYKKRVPHANGNNKNDAKYIINSMAEKISGDALFKANLPTEEDNEKPKDQVARLIHEATKTENLANMYFGWAPFI
ncbi:hypothetical protein F4703DRAFT_1839595 [Phycomyces blakesleeanus]